MKTPKTELNKRLRKQRIAAGMLEHRVWIPAETEAAFQQEYIKACDSWQIPENLRTKFNKRK